MITQDDISISVTVMTHPRRWQYADALRREHPTLDIEIVVDPDPEGTPSSMRTAKLAWKSADPGGTHHLVLEDDAVLCDDFSQNLLAAVAANPNVAVSLHGSATSRVSFSGRLAALAGKPSAIPVGPYVPTVACVLPVENAREFSEFISKYAVLANRHDQFMKRYLDERGTASVVTVPNLVDHLPLPTLEGNFPSDGRRSFCFINPVPDIDWSPSPYVPSLVPYLMYPPHRHAVGLLPRQSVKKEPSSRAALDLLAELGAPATEIAESFVDAVKSLGSARARINDIAFSLWLTAALLGLSHRCDVVRLDGVKPTGDLNAALLFLATLRSWAEGVLEKRKPELGASTDIDALSTFLRRGVEVGLLVDPPEMVSLDRL